MLSKNNPNNKNSKINKKEEDSFDSAEYTQNFLVGIFNIFFEIIF